MRYFSTCSKCRRKIRKSSCVTDTFCPYCGQIQPEVSLEDFILQQKEWNALTDKLYEHPNSLELWKQFWKYKDEKDLFYEAICFRRIGREYIEEWLNSGIESILFAGNGVSQSPKICYYAGFRVVAIDICSYATRYAICFPFKEQYLVNHYFRFVDEKPVVCLSPFPKREGGSLEFETGDFTDLELLQEQFDVIICMATLQYYRGVFLEKACQSLLVRLNPNGFLLVGVVNSPDAAKEIQKTLVKEGVTVLENYLRDKRPSKGKIAEIYYISG